MRRKPAKTLRLPTRSPPAGSGRRHRVGLTAAGARWTVQSSKLSSASGAGAYVLARRGKRDMVAGGRAFGKEVDPGSTAASAGTPVMSTRTPGKHRSPTSEGLALHLMPRIICLQTPRPKRAEGRANRTLARQPGVVACFPMNDPAKRERAALDVLELLPEWWAVGPTSYDPGTGRWTWTARGRHPGRGKTPERITGTGEDELAAMVDLRIRRDERRVSRSSLGTAESA